jgi:hypothetical protein
VLCAPEIACGGSPLCAALWILLVAGATTSALFLVEFVVNAFRNGNRSS